MASTMQPSQKAFEAARGYLASLGASLDAGRGLSIEALAPVSQARNAPDAVDAVKTAAKGAISNSMRDRASYFEGVGQSRLARELNDVSTVTRPGKGVDSQWGSVDITTVDPSTYLANWAKVDPKGFDGFERHVEAMAQDFAALRKISPATAEVTADLVVLGNAKCSDVVRHAVAVKIKQASPEAPKSGGFKI